MFFGRWSFHQSVRHRRADGRLAEARLIIRRSRYAGAESSSGLGRNLARLRPDATRGRDQLRPRGGLREGDLLSAVTEIGETEAWQHLSASASAQLIDVRTAAEWAFVGVVDLTAIGKTPILIEWQRFPDQQVDSDFVHRLSAALRDRGVGEDDQLFFLCRSGARSRAAANAMSVAGYRACHNVTGGFEGPLDSDGHRGTVGGWKVAGLPWSQS